MCGNSCTTDFMEDIMNTELMEDLQKIKDKYVQSNDHVVDRDYYKDGACDIWKDIIMLLKERGIL